MEILNEAFSMPWCELPVHVGFNKASNRIHSFEPRGYLVRRKQKKNQRSYIGLDMQVSLNGF